MGRYINLGNAGFESVRKGFYVDKSGVIAYINSTLGTPDKLTCVSRPRRFGKSFAAKMLCAYYDKSCDSGALFQDLEIAQDPSYEKYLNQYDVIYLDITWFISTAACIKDTVKYLQREVIQELQEVFPQIQEKSESLPVALVNANKVTGKKFIVVIDEWDALFREAKDDDELLKEYVQLLRGLFKSSQTDKIIEAAYMTGILPIKKYGTQSALTDFREYTMIQPKRLAEYVGFTESEVQDLCERHHMDFEAMKNWYDGYSFSRVKSVYSPNSVMEAIKNEEISNYWTQTETYESLKLYIDMDFDGIKAAIVNMLGGQRCIIDTGTFQNDITSLKNRDDVFTLLVHLGYLAYDINTKEVFIPNQEVREEFIRAIKNGGRPELVRAIQVSDQLLAATLRMDGGEVAKLLEEVHSANTAPDFYNNEQSLRNVIQMAYLSSVDHYLQIQELASGVGYADVLFWPKRGSDKPMLLVELKWDKSAETAIAQIKEKKYVQAIENFGGEILFVGVNYNKKTKKHQCLIERYRKNKIG